MRVLKVLEHHQMAGTELSTHASSQSLKARGHEIFLMHNLVHDLPFDYYSKQLSIPNAFKSKNYFTLLSKNDLSLIHQFVTENKIDIVHFHTNCHSSVSKFLCQLMPSLYTRHVPLCPNGSKYLWKKEKACQDSPSIKRCTLGFLYDGCGTLGGGQPWSTRGFSYAIYQFYKLKAELLQYSKIIVVSRAHQREIQKDFDLTTNVEYVPEPIVFNSENNHNLTFSQTTPVILAAGRLVPFKGFDHLIEAASKLKNNFRLIIAGDGPQKDILQGLITKYNLDKKIEIIGHVNHEQMEKLFAQCNLCVVPSLWKETLCRVGIEAMSWGKPVVAYYQGGIKDWLNNNLNGLAVQPGDINSLARAIDTLLINDKLSQALGNEGLQISKEWSFENHASTLENIMKSVTTNYVQ